MIRPASISEAAALSQIALDAKRYWGYPESWIERWESDLTVTPEFINHNQVFVAESDGEIRGFYALSLEGAKAELEHMWVRPQYIGTGVGKELFLDAMDRAAAMSVREVGISADPNAAGFYERMGATRVGETDASIDGQNRKLPRLKIET
jgi:N-acetylglutamate synthase-like GNAT family acetyltransferase